MSSDAPSLQGCPTECTMCLWSYDHTPDKGHALREAEEALYLKESSESILYNERLAVIYQMNTAKEKHEQNFKKYLVDQVQHNIYYDFNPAMIRVLGLEAQIKANPDPKRVECLTCELICIKRFQTNIEKKNRELTSREAELRLAILARVKDQVNGQISQAKIELQASLREI